MRFSSCAILACALVLVFTVITSLFIHNNLPTEIQNIAKGAIIVGAALIQVVRQPGTSRLNLGTQLRTRFRTSSNSRRN